MAMIAPAAKAVGPRGERSFSEYLTALEQQSALTTLDNLMTFPWVKALTESGKLKLHAAYFGVATGDLSVYDPTQKKFVRVAPATHAKAFASPRF
jgi:carbonic anhydrase